MNETSHADAATVLRRRISEFPDGPPSASAIASAVGDGARCLSGLEPAWFGARACGTAYTVSGAHGDNLGLIFAFSDAAPGDIIFFDAPGEHTVAYFGDILALAGLRRSIAGLITTTPIRDRREVADLGFPTFHRGTSPRSPVKNSPGTSGVELVIDGVTIRPGDLVAADADGVVVVALDEAQATLDAAEAVLAKERNYCEALSAGAIARDLMHVGGGS